MMFVFVWLIVLAVASLGVTIGKTSIEGRLGGLIALGLHVAAAYIVWGYL